MSSATKSAPRFRVGDWVMFPFGIRRVLAEVIEDRGPIGYRGRRLYGVRLDRSQPEPRTTEVPEENLESAPREILTPEAARERGISTEYWPRHEFAITYLREGNTHEWASCTKGGLVLEGVNARGPVGYSTARYGSESQDDENFAIITVLLEYDPRLRDPREAPLIWRTMAEQARTLADKWFKAQHPKAVIEPD
jgi:hypothetical protein